MSNCIVKERVRAAQVPALPFHVHVLVCARNAEHIPSLKQYDDSSAPDVAFKLHNTKVMN